MKLAFSLLSFFLGIAITSTQAPFVTTWKTNSIGTSCNSCITIPTHPESTYNYEVDWDNDGVYDTVGVTGDITHDFGSSGIYTIAIRGDFPRIYFNRKGDKEKILSVDQWGDIQWESMGSAFSGCYDLNGLLTDTPNLTQVVDMDSMFLNALSFNQDISGWNVSNVKNMRMMFKGAKSFNQNIGNWDVSNVTDMSQMFSFASSFNQELGDWNVSNVRQMALIFNGAKSFNQDISKWDITNVTNMDCMFCGAESFNQDISEWDVSNVTNMNSLFSGAEMFNQDIGTWDVSNVRNMNCMFCGTDRFNQDISNWDVSQVRNMRSMFSYAQAFDQDISKWNVSNVTDMGLMFSDTRIFNQNIGSWNLSAIKDMERMWDGSSLSCENYSTTLIGWADNSETPNNIDLGAQDMLYGSFAKAARDALLDKGWSITGDNEGSCTVSSQSGNLAPSLYIPIQQRI